MKSIVKISIAFLILVSGTAKAQDYYCSKVKVTSLTSVTTGCLHRTEIEILSNPAPWQRCDAYSYTEINVNIRASDGTLIPVGTVYLSINDNSVVVEITIPDDCNLAQQNWVYEVDSGELDFITSAGGRIFGMPCF